MEPNAACVVSGAGMVRANGVYIRSGEFRGLPRYKHESEELYIRQGGSGNSGYGILAGAESHPDAWCYFCETSRNRVDIQDVPHEGEWITHGGMGATDPPPSVTSPSRSPATPVIAAGEEHELSVHTMGGVLCSVWLTREATVRNAKRAVASSQSRQVAELALVHNGALLNDDDVTLLMAGVWEDPVLQLIQIPICVVSGAGMVRANGVYIRSGGFRGLPRYKHESQELYIRQGGSGNRGYGILAGAESYPGAWCYFCETSRDRFDLQDVPHCGKWVNHGGMGAVDPPPSVTSPLSLFASQDVDDNPNAVCVVSCAGVACMNGTYVRDGTFRGKPRYKHVAENVWIRHGGEGLLGYGIASSKDSPSDSSWAYFCETSRDRFDFPDVPNHAEWICKSASDPPPEVEGPYEP